jgi:homoserine dehydrogenase
VGGVGKAILSALTSAPLSARFQLILVANSRLALSLPLPAGSAPLTPVNVGPVIEQHGIPLDIPSVLSVLSQHPDAPGVIVDATGASSVPDMYPQILKMGVHVVTPNKKGASGDIELWNAVVDAAYPNGPATYYGESTVGAGLPILQSLKDLVATGDEIEKIEGVFSGTLSYIFNEFSQVEGGNVKFSDVVKVAKDKGYTVCRRSDQADDRNPTRAMTFPVPTLLAS